jgi:hypothetical protein
VCLLADSHGGEYYNMRFRCLQVIGCLLRAARLHAPRFVSLMLLLFLVLVVRIICVTQRQANFEFLGLLPELIQAVEEMGWT